MNGPWQFMPAVYEPSVLELSSSDIVAARTPDDLPHVVHAKIQSYNLIK
jgi:hypothetical protein